MNVAVIRPKTFSSNFDAFPLLYWEKPFNRHKNPFKHFDHPGKIKGPFDFALISPNAFDHQKINGRLN